MAIASVMAVIVLTIISAVAGTMLPEGTQLPIHWGLSGEPDDFADKWVALALPPAMVAGVSLLFYFLPSLEPRRQGLKRSQGLYLWGWAAILMIGAAIQIAVLSEAFGWDVPVNRLVAGAVGVMLAMIGNQLSKSRSMYMVGIRTPWTLASEEVWIKTHRLGGKLMVLGGLALVAAALLPLPPAWLGIVALFAILLGAVVPILYSFIAWRREQADQARG